jgi:hypothetical protein
MNRLSRTVQCFFYQDNTVDRYFQQTVPTQQHLPNQQKEMIENKSRKFFSYLCLFSYLKYYKMGCNPTAVGVSRFFIE